MNRLVLSLVGVLALSCGAFAAPANLPQCPTVGFALSELLTGSLSTGCYDQDKAYYNFQYSGGNASGITVSIGTTPIGPIDQHTVNFQSSPAWLTPFTLNYIIEVIDPNPSEVIYYAALGMTSTSLPGMPNNSSITEVLDPDVGANVTLVATPVNIAASATSYARLIEVSNSVNPSGATITQFTNTFFEQVIPEPGTYAIIGSGLLALALVRRRRA